MGSVFVVGERFIKVIASRCNRLTCCCFPGPIRFRPRRIGKFDGLSLFDFWLVLTSSLLLLLAFPSVFFRQSPDHLRSVAAYFPKKQSLLLGAVLEHHLNQRVVLEGEQFRLQVGEPPNDRPEAKNLLLQNTLRFSEFLTQSLHFCHVELLKYPCQVLAWTVLSSELLAASCLLHTCWCSFSSGRRSHTLLSVHLLTVCHDFTALFLMLLSSSCCAGLLMVRFCNACSRLR